MRFRYCRNLGKKGSIVFYICGDAVTLSKATGGAAYTLALPAAAPAANTYLQYTGTNYAWGAGGSVYTTSKTVVNVTVYGGTLPDGAVTATLTFVCTGASVTCQIAMFGFTLYNTATHVTIPVPAAYIPQQGVQFLYRMQAWSGITSYGTFIKKTVDNDTIALYYDLNRTTFNGGSGTTFLFGPISFAYTLI